MSDMSDEERERLRAKQDRIIELASRHNINPDLRITYQWEGTPTIWQLRDTLWPEFEAAIDYAIEILMGKSTAYRASAFWK